jgi:hypothetical protein
VQLFAVVGVQLENIFEIERSLLAVAVRAGGPIGVDGDLLT